MVFEIASFLLILLQISLWVVLPRTLLFYSLRALQHWQYNEAPLVIVWAVLTLLTFIAPILSLR